MCTPVVLQATRQFDCQRSHTHQCRSADSGGIRWLRAHSFFDENSKCSFDRVVFQLRDDRSIIDGACCWNQIYLKEIEHQN